MDEITNWNEQAGDLGKEELLLDWRGYKNDPYRHINHITLTMETKLIVVPKETTIPVVVPPLRYSMLIIIAESQ